MNNQATTLSVKAGAVSADFSAQEHLYISSILGSGAGGPVALQMGSAADDGSWPIYSGFSMSGDMTPNGRRKIGTVNFYNPTAYDAVIQVVTGDAEMHGDRTKVDRYGRMVIGEYDRPTFRFEGDVTIDAANCGLLYIGGLGTTAKLQIRRIEVVDPGEATAETKLGIEIHRATTPLPTTGTILTGGPFMTPDAYAGTVRSKPANNMNSLNFIARGYQRIPAAGAIFDSVRLLRFDYDRFGMKSLTNSSASGFFVRATNVAAVAGHTSMRIACEISLDN